MTASPIPAAGLAECRPATRAVRAGIDCDTAHGAVTPPLVLSSNFSFDGFGNKRDYDYTRSGNPTRDLLGEALAGLEGGAGGVVTATGMGAITLVLHALLEAGDTLVVPHDAYGGSWRLFNALAAKGHFELVTADLTDPCSLADALATSPKLVLVETPSNPLLRITDLRLVIDAAHRAGARVVVDNTFATPLLQHPLELGADVVVHSATKYIAGHSDVLLGVAVARDPDLVAALRERRTRLGAVPGPLEAFLALRGLRTLPVRLERASATAAELAQRLAAHPRVEVVRYPGLPGDPGHARAAAQMDGFGAMLSFDVVGGARAADAVCEAVRVAVHTTSLGGVETTLERRAANPGQEHLPPGLVRLSVGCEHVEDLWRDLDGALRRSAEVAASA